MSRIRYELCADCLSMDDPRYITGCDLCGKGDCAGGIRDMGGSTSRTAELEAALALADREFVAYRREADAEIARLRALVEAVRRDAGGTPPGSRGE